MVDVKSLMIGNYLKFPFINEPQQVSDIERIMQDNGEYEYYITPANDKFRRHVSLIDPIPLSSDILLACGFEHIQGNFWGDDYFSIQLMIDSTENPVIVYIFQVMDINEYSKHSSVEIKYLHQLQNAYYFKTGGKELTITL